MQTYLAPGHKGRNLLVFDHTDGARRVAKIHRIEDHNGVVIPKKIHQVQALGATVGDGQILGNLIVSAQGLHAAHTKALVGPQDIADTQRQGPVSAHSRSSLK